ncbi:MAG TPA: glycosyltransferase family 4 protein [Candidatus Saccharimonadales bacterium]|nr:glycosyltransferase family 4 protein [Candidatus Saccharimonadales bacterium]
MLSQKEEIIILCRKNGNNKIPQENKYKKIQVVFFDPKIQLLETPSRYKTVFYELYRTVKLYKSLAIVLYKQIKMNKRSSLALYVVNSPLTLSVFCLFFARIFTINNTILEFHDLEPEMAIHIKKLKKRSIIISIEYFLEKFLCKFYKKIIVTNKIQKDILSKRTGTSKKKIFVLPNTINHSDFLSNSSEKVTLKNIKKNDFVIGYISTLSFDYTVVGICSLLKKISPVVSKYPDIKFLIVGDGDGVKKIKEVIENCRIEANVLLTGKISNVENILSRINVCIIPWEKNVFTQTILPTKLFEYLSAKKPVIVPDFGGFTEVIKPNKNGLRFNSNSDLISKIIELKNDNNKMVRISENGYKTFIKYFDLVHFENNYREFLHI